VVPPPATQQGPFTPFFLLFSTIFQTFEKSLTPSDILQENHHLQHMLAFFKSFCKGFQTAA
jgi:hypothetical protein